MKGLEAGEKRAPGAGGSRVHCATPDSTNSNACYEGRGRSPCRVPRRGNKRRRLSGAQDCGAARSDASVDCARQEAHHGGGEGRAPWGELPFGTLQMIMDELLRMQDGEAWVRRCGCVCRCWRGVSAELLMTDTAASRPPRRTPAPQPSVREEGGATSLAVLKEDDSMSKSVNGGGSEHQSPAFAGQPPWFGDQTPHPQAFRMIRLSLDGQVHSLRLGHAGHHLPFAGRPHDWRGQDARMPWVDFSEQRLLSGQQAESQPLGRNAPASCGRGSELAAPSPQRAIVEDVNLMSESDAEGGCGMSSLRTADCSEGSARSRPVPQATC